MKAATAARIPSARERAVITVRPAASLMVTQLPLRKDYGVIGTNAAFDELY
jgi:hypothetical protein